MSLSEQLYLPYLSPEQLEYVLQLSCALNIPSFSVALVRTYLEISNFSELSDQEKINLFQQDILTYLWIFLRNLPEEQNLNFSPLTKTMIMEKLKNVFSGVEIDDEVLADIERSVIFHSTRHL